MHVLAAIALLFSFMALLIWTIAGNPDDVIQPSKKKAGNKPDA